LSHYDEARMPDAVGSLVRLFVCLCALALFCFANDTQKEALGAISRAQQLSQIRFASAPPFHIQASFVSYGETGTTSGTYMEHWVSGLQWRRETVIGDFRRTEVGSGTKQWMLDSSPKVPPEAGTPSRLLDAWNFNMDFWKIKNVRDVIMGGAQARCLETVKDATGGKSALCFDSASGTLVARVTPIELLDRVEDHTCRFLDYQKFGLKVFPRLIRCFDADKLKLELQITELNTPDTFSADLFAQPTGAQETMNCPSPIKPPKVIYSPGPSLPKHENPRQDVVLQVLVGKDGRPHDIKVTQSVDSAFDDAAMQAVRQWKFDPSRCEGVPIENQVVVRVGFHVY
jgi:TonB family protein